MLFSTKFKKYQIQLTSFILSLLCKLSQGMSDMRSWKDQEPYIANSKGWSIGNKIFLGVEKYSQQVRNYLTKFHWYEAQSQTKWNKVSSRLSGEKGKMRSCWRCVLIILKQVHLKNSNLQNSVVKSFLYAKIAQVNAKMIFDGCIYLIRFFPRILQLNSEPNYFLTCCAICLCAIFEKIHKNTQPVLLLLNLWPQH